MKYLRPIYHKNKVMPRKDITIICTHQVSTQMLKKLHGVVVFGARGVMREFARLKSVAKENAKELRQLSMAQYVAPPTVAIKKGKIKEVNVAARASDNDLEGEWIRVLSQGNMERPYLPSLPPSSERRH
jgi:hypothetical protein